MIQTKTVLLAITAIFWILLNSGFSVGRGELKVSVLNVGQGDSILVEYPNGMLMLVDGGAGAKVLSELGEVLPPWERTIDIVLLTHDHADHLNGLFSVVQRYHVKTVLLRLDSCMSGECLRFLELAREAGVSIVDVNPLDSPKHLEVGSVMVDVFEFSSMGSVNNTSMALVIQYGDFSMSLNGDLETEGEEKLIAGMEAVDIEKIDVLKAGHHCSRTASSAGYLEYVRPSVAICSVGEGNSFGHPHAEALDRFQEYDVEYVRTDVSGRITVNSDGKAWNVEVDE
jgi:competence protein ComEC